MTLRLLDRAVRFSPLVAVPFAFGAIHHVMAVVSPDASDTSSATRHVVFVGINLFFCAAFGLRANWTIFPVTLLALQQIYSHGSAFLEARRVGVFDSQSFAVLGFLPVVLIAAFALFKKRAPTDAA